MSEENEVVIERVVDTNQVGWPAAAIAEAEDGAFGNREYHDLRGISWKNAKEILKLEEEALSRTNWDVQAAADALDEDDVFEILYGLDIGVASTVAALSAARCCPTSSCNGGPGHHELYPLVAFYTRQARLPDFMAVAEKVNCGLVNGGAGDLVVYAGHVSRLIEFARELIARRESLAKLNVQTQKPSIKHDTSQLRLFD